MRWQRMKLPKENVSSDFFVKESTIKGYFISLLANMLETRIKTRNEFTLKKISH
jgi:hypothetical protein